MESNAGVKIDKLHLVMTGGYSSNGVYQFSHLPGYSPPASIFEYLNGDQAAVQMVAMAKRGYRHAALIDSLLECLGAVEDLIEYLKDDPFDGPWTSVRGVSLGMSWGVCFTNKEDIAKFMLLYSGPTHTGIV
jgi:hypothetical protein